MIKEKIRLLQVNIGKEISEFGINSVQVMNTSKELNELINFYQYLLDKHENVKQLF